MGLCVYANGVLLARPWNDSFFWKIRESSRCRLALWGRLRSVIVLLVLVD